eukprot:TRINITY_DN13054_c0_g1_i1.p1 TRINITY_DN13054_c0_g1~~TRINITY_DN13054_c0_g1_i1.p1  ORF type:complete len:104 (+),score=7.65 TRINITY_DN13054_c0_g1_i1:720-1031(+)
MAITIAVLGFYVYHDQLLTASQTFSIISTFSVLTTALTNLPDLISKMTEANLSLNRISKFLYASEIEPLTTRGLQVGQDEVYALAIENGSFQSMSQPILQSLW